MSRTKALISILMILILIALSGASVWAAPGGQEPGAAEPTEEPTPEPTEEPTEAPGEASEAAEPAEEPPDEEPLTEHPVASALAKFFFDRLGLNPDDIMVYHEEDGMGFGVIAQACWMSLAYDDPASKLPDIIAFKNGDLDFNSIDLPDGTTATNWGQFKKGVLRSGKFQKDVTNLGAIMSERAESPVETDGDDLGAAADQGQGKGKKGKGPGEDGPPGKSKGGKKGGGPPAIPPGQEKDKGGRKGKGQE